ncbi:MAG TPA: DUF1688 family protein, partial [Lautropia sp.]|nr:DUF1688 family protein [Lautropia sp.]
MTDQKAASLRSDAGPAPAEAQGEVHVEVLARLRSPEVIRTRCRQILAALTAGESAHFEFEPSQLATAADQVAAVTRRRYPDLVVPFHSRWRHFEAGGVNRHV